MKVERIDRARCAQQRPAQLATAIRARVPGVASVETHVAEIVADVRERGEAAVLELTSRFDATSGACKPLRVSQEALDDAIVRLPHELVAGLQVAIANVSEVASAGVGADRVVRLPQGHTVAVREIPVDSAAVYVPGGRAPYPSTAVMGVVTARAAGVLDVSVCSPPGPDGEIAVGVLGACRLLGVEKVYRMGGAQAVAALAYGTDSVDPVDVIVGPGNLYVQEAKRQLAHVAVGIDGVAGPSDLTLVASRGADVRLAALDLLAQAEHGQASLVVLVSCEDELLDAIARELESAALDAGGAVAVAVHCDSVDAAVAIADAIAPEHLQLVGGEAEALAHHVRHAGCLFVGVGSGTAFGDYVAGSNHVLPTGGTARFSSTLDTRCFRRRMSEVRIPLEAAETLAAAGGPIADVEGFRFHAASMRARAPGAEGRAAAEGRADAEPAGERDPGESER